MIDMVLDQTGANARWSPTTSPRGALNKSSRSRRGIDGSSSFDKDFASKKYRRGSCHSRLHEEYEFEEREISRESKKVRYSDHHRDKNFRDSLERRHYSRERLPRRHVTDSGGEERHELSKNSRSSPKRRYHRDSARNGLSRNGPWSGDQTNITEARRSSKWRSNDDKWGCHTEHGNSLSWNGSKWGKEANTKGTPNSSQQKSVGDDLDSNVKTANSLSCTSSKWVDETNAKDAPGLWRSSATKWDAKEINNHSSWNGSKWDDRATAKDAPRSSQWRSDIDKCCSNVKTDNSSSWPKLGDEATTDDASKSSTWRTNADRQGSNMKTGNSSSWPKWNDIATTEDAPNSSSWRTNAGRKGSIMKMDSCSSWPKWDDETNTEDAPNSSRWRTNADRQGSNMKTGNSSSWPKWNDITTTEDAPNSSSWRTNADRKGSNMKTDNSSSWPKWDGKTATKDAPNSFWRTNAGREGSNMKTDNCSSWPKWDDKTTKDAPNSSRWRTNVGREGSNMKTDNSSSWPKWDDKTTTKDAPNSSWWRTNAGREGSNIKTDNCSSWPKWDEESTEDAPNSSRWWTDAGREGSNMKTDNCLSWPKWDDKTTKVAPNSSQWRTNVGREGSNMKTDNSSSWPMWDDKTTKDAPNSSHWSTNADRKGSNVKADNTSSWLKSGNETNTEDASNSFCWRSVADGQGSNVRTLNSSSWLKWEDEPNTEDAPNSSQQRKTADRQHSNMKTDSSSSWPKWGDKTATVDAPTSSLWRTNADIQGETDNISTWQDPKRGDNGLSQNDLHQCGHTITTGAPNSIDWRSDADKKDYIMETDNIVLLNGSKLADQGSADASIYPQWKPAYDQETDCKFSLSVPKNITREALSGAHQRSLPSHEKNITQETSRKDQQILNISKSPSRNLNEDQNQQMVCSISTTGKDAMPQPCGQDKKSEWYSHQVGSSKQLSQLSATLKPFSDEASAATTTVPFQPSLRFQSTKPITSDSGHLEHPTIVRESQKSPRSLAPLSCKCVQSSHGDVSWISNWEGNLQNEKRGHKEPELIRDAVTEATEAQTRQSTEKQNTSHPNVTDCDMRKGGETNREDEKGIRLFKFAIVNFVKDILRPIWKEGRLSKDSHKIIVKKVVDKVTGALHGTSIPRKQKDIDLYISFSKEKLTDLVQAYLERYAKS